MRQPNSILPILCCLLLAACGSAPERPSPRNEQAVKLNASARAAYLQGDHERALSDYAQALRIDQSIENAAGIAVNRFNLARVFRETARPDLAHLQLEALFAQPALAYPPHSLAAAAALRGQLYFEGGGMPSAASWVARGEALCEEKCPVAGSLLLLRAQLAWCGGNLDEAGKLADESVAALKPGGQPVELANALRLSGEIGLAKQDHAGAIRWLEQALALDQRLGIPTRIRLDLLRLGEAHERSGATGQAGDFYARAAAVGQATGRKGGDKVHVCPNRMSGDKPGTITRGAR
ncbi:MAG: tetratricopeptide repeat protein [Nitrosomonadales bacterium]|nr:tetratricopeptide repeat protein [Nitrosomonadales bacterium]